MSLFIQVTAQILNDIHFIAIVYRLDRGECDADFRPKATQDDVLAARRLDGLAKAWIIPGVHRRALDDFLAGEDIKQLRPHVAAE